MACAGAGAILSIRWSGVGYPFETIDTLDSNRIVPGATPTLKLLY
jgi:hypothetical protein